MTIASNSFTTTAAGATLDDGSLPAIYTLVVYQVGGTATSWTIALQGSVDGTNWFTILSHTNSDGSGVAKGNSTMLVARFLRLNCTAVSLGTATSLLAQFAAI